MYKRQSWKRPIRRPSSIRTSTAARYSSAEYRAPVPTTSRNPGSSSSRCPSLRRCAARAAPLNHRVWKASTGSVKSGSVSVTYAPSSASRSTPRRTADATAGRTATCPPSEGEYATRSPRTPSARASVYDPGTGPSADQSRASGVPMTSSISAASAASRVIGPTCARVPKALAG